MAIQLPNTAVLKSLNPKTRRSLLVAAFTLLLLRTRIADIPKAAFSKLKKVSIRQEVTQEELAQALQQVYVDELDGSKTLLVPYKGYISKVRNIAPISTSFVELLGRSPSPRHLIPSSPRTRRTFH